MYSIYLLDIITNKYLCLHSYTFITNLLTVRIRFQQIIDILVKQIVEVH